MSGWQPVIESSEVADPGSRKHVQVLGRHISLIRSKDGETLYAIDSVCYHFGGPLTVGDVEDVNGWECVRCPWHDTAIRLADGAKPYKHMEADAEGKLTIRTWQVSEHRQRTHNVKEEDGTVFVQLTSIERVDRNEEDPHCMSDRWAHNTEAAGHVTRHATNSGTKLKAAKKKPMDVSRDKGDMSESKLTRANAT